MNSKFVAVDGLKVHCYESGDPKKPPLILLHGLHGNAASLRDVAEFLSAHYYVLAFDLPGYGLSHELRTRFTIDNVARHLVACIEKIGIQEYYLSGVSMGGSIALEIGFCDKKRVKGFIFLTPLFSGAHIHVQYAHKERALQLLRLFNNPFMMKTFLPLVVNNDALLSRIVKNIFYRRLLTDERIQITLASIRASTPAAYVSSLLSAFNYHAKENSATFGQPTVILLNPHDTSIDPDKTMEFARKKFRKLTLIEIVIESHNPAEKPTAMRIQKSYPGLMKKIRTALH